MKVCTRCAIEKPLDDFAFRSRMAGTRIGHCKACQARYFRSYYTSNIEDERTRARRVNADNRKRLRVLVTQLKRRPCSDCLQTYNPWQMDFDHLPGHLKKDAISRLVSTGSFNAIKAELLKCELVCANCHRERTYRRRGSTRKAPVL